MADCAVCTADRLMVFQMLSDVGKFLVLLLVSLFAFSSAAYVLFQPGGQGVTAQPDAGLTLTWAMADECTTAFTSFPTALAFILESSITGENFFACARTLPFPTSGYLLALGSYTIAGLLLLNMLIAIMAKTFDNVWEGSSMNFLFLFAQIVFSSKKDPVAPPPFYILQLPYDTWCAVQFLLRRRKRPEQPEAPAMRRESVSKQEEQELQQELQQEQQQEQQQQEGGLTTHAAGSRGRRSTAAGRRKRAAASQRGGGGHGGAHDARRELACAIEDYIKANQEDVAQDERWRSGLMKRMYETGCKVDEAHVSLESRITGVESKLDRMMAMLLEHRLVEDESRPAATAQSERQAAALAPGRNRVGSVVSTQV
jgi:hypothetical protein